jgi:hypothetical protein
LASKTWKGVVKKNKFDLPEHHENKVGVGANSLLQQNRVVTPGGLLVAKKTPSQTGTTTNSSAQAAAQAQKQRHASSSYKTSLH